MSNKDNKIFDTWEDIKQCSDCEHWWNNTCDSVDGKQCKAYTPTRKVTIPNDIKQLKTQMIFVHVVLIVLAVLHIVEVLL